MLGLSYWDMVKKYRGWDNSVLPVVYEHKRPVKQRQKTYLGYDVLTIAVPILDAQGAVRHVGSTSATNATRRRSLARRPDHHPRRALGRTPRQPHLPQFGHDRGGCGGGPQGGRAQLPLPASGRVGLRQELLAKFIHTRANARTSLSWW
jgi:hypothetical protein